MQAILTAYAVNNPKGLSKLFEEIDPRPRTAPEVGTKWWVRGQAAGSAGSV